jgi:hypothetical protein
VNLFVTFFDGVLGGLLAAGAPGTAVNASTLRWRWLTTRMHFYDAELVRLRAKAHDEPAARQADIGAANAPATGAQSSSNCVPHLTISKTAVSQPAPLLMP